MCPSLGLGRFVWDIWGFSYTMFVYAALALVLSPAGAPAGAKPGRPSASAASTSVHSREVLLLGSPPAEPFPPIATQKAAAHTPENFLVELKLPVLWIKL